MPILPCHRHGGQEWRQKMSGFGPIRTGMGERTGVIVTYALSLLRFTNHSGSSPPVADLGQDRLSQADGAGPTQEEDQ